VSSFGSLRQRGFDANPLSTEPRDWQSFLSGCMRRFIKTSLKLSNKWGPGGKKKGCNSSRRQPLFRHQNVLSRQLLLKRSTNVKGARERQLGYVLVGSKFVKKTLTSLGGGIFGIRQEQSRSDTPRPNRRRSYWGTVPNSPCSRTFCEGLGGKNLTQGKSTSGGRPGQADLERPCPKHLQRIGRDFPAIMRHWSSPSHPYTRLIKLRRLPCENRPGKENMSRRRLTQSGTPWLTLSGHTFLLALTEEKREENSEGDVEVQTSRSLAGE